MRKSESNRKLIVVGGPNGSGKTTLAREILDEQDFEYISADEIAYELAPDNPESVKIQAGKEFFKRLYQSVLSQRNILIESTLSGKSLVPLLQKFKAEDNYSISLVFIFLTNPQVCVERIDVRVRKGGHHVPKEDVYRRFKRSIVNFWSIYKELADNWHLYYTSEDFFQEVAREENKKNVVLDETLFVKFKELKKKYE